MACHLSFGSPLLVEAVELGFDRSVRRMRINNSVFGKGQERKSSTDRRMEEVSLVKRSTAGQTRAKIETWRHFSLQDVISS
jgi:hypothetical protein